MKKAIYLLLFICIGLLSCQDEADVVNNDSVLEKVVGKVISPSEQPIVNALVFYDDQGELYTTRTNQIGEFEIYVPIGAGELHIQTGDGRLFNTSVAINVDLGTPLLLTDLSLRLADDVNLAYLAGSFDNIETLVEGLGYDITEVTVADIENGLTNYNALFLNCGGPQPNYSSAFYEGLNNFVIAGNSLYASDWALEYLVGDDSNTVNCDDERPGGFIDDALVCGTRQGNSGMYYNNSIVNNDISAYLNASNVDIEFDSPQWMQIQDYDAGFWDVLIEDENNNPLMLKTNQLEGLGDDSIWYSEDGSMVTICHVPPGNPENAHTITVSVNALDAHLAHGDTIGACNAESGNIYYTSFHNHVGGEETIASLMEYIILNL